MERLPATSLGRAPGGSTLRSAKERRELAMGVWGTGPTQSDEAYDFLSHFFGDLFGSKKIQELRGAFKYSDAYGRIQTGAHILQMLGDVLHWPDKHEEELKELLELAVLRLTAMVTPVEGKPPEFLTLWSENDAKEAAASVQAQIDDLKKKRERLG
jgi:hypothetical protein